MWIQTSGHRCNISHCKQKGFHRAGRTRAKTKEEKPSCEFNEGIRGSMRELGISCNESLRV
jgi:hypothetical protein